jgi:hypothetical protein
MFRPRNASPGVASPGPVRVRPLKLSYEHVPTFFKKGPVEGEGSKAYNMYQCNTELLVGRKCSSTIKNKTFDGVPATAGTFKVGVKSGYTNLFAHTVTCCPEWPDVWMKSTSDGPLVPFVTCDSKSKNIYGWIDLIMAEKLPFSYVSKEKVRRYTNLDPISRTT